MMLSWPLYHYILKAAMRDRLIVSILVALVVVTSLSVFIGSSAVIEKYQFSSVFTAAGLRMVGTFGLCLFVVFQIRRLHESKEIDLLLSRPVGRFQLLVSFSMALSSLAVIIGLLEGLCLLVVSFSGFSDGHLFWTISIIAENIIMVNVAMFFAMVVKSAATTSLVVLAFYILSRLMDQILGIIDTGTKLLRLDFLEWIMQVISAFMPRLDLMGQSSWLVYGALEYEKIILFIFSQCVVYVWIMIVASYFDLRHKQF